jgi:hypothetical protein
MALHPTAPGASRVADEPTWERTEAVAVDRSAFYLDRMIRNGFAVGALSLLVAAGLL